MLINYKVINITFQIHGFSNSEWEKFETEDLTPNFVVDILNKVQEIHGLEYYENTVAWSHISRCASEMMFIDKNWEHALILPLHNQSYLDRFFCQLFYTHAVRKKILYLHGSLISHQVHGLMFLGPSGIGKTTQAELWNRYRDALIINGDVVFVQETENTFLGWGTPWHGSSPYCENTNVPVHAMIVLKQSPENSIRELTGFEKVTAVSQSVFYPRWLEKGMELCLETLDHLLTKVPVYELSCRPDEEAVRLTEEAVFGKAVI